MDKVSIFILLVIAFLVSFYDFLFMSPLYNNDTNSTTSYYSGGAGGGYAGSYSSGNSIRGKSSNSWHRGSGSRGK